MKINVNVTVRLTPDQVKCLKAAAEDTGHSFDGTKAPGKLIRRLLEAAVYERITRAEADYDPGAVGS